jgi:DNA replication protein DnaC
MKAATLSNELCQSLKRLRLGQLIPTLGERIALAEKQQLPLDDFLLSIFSEEVGRRESSAASRRADEGGLDATMVMERWDASAKVQLDRRLLQELCALRFVQDHRNVVILGPVGVGKTFVANALGHLACRAGFTTRLERADSLLRKLRQSRMDNSRDALMASLCAVDILIVDDFALEPMSREESRDVYQLMIERNARSSTIVTSNRDTSEWLAVFDDAMLAQSAIDRFKNNAYDLVIEGESYRSRQKPTLSSEPMSAPVIKTSVSSKRRKR